MKIIPLPEQFRRTVEMNDGLNAYLEKLQRGREFTPRSWLYEQYDPDKVLEMWMHRLSALESGDTFEKEVFQFDTSQLEKWGPQGGYPPVSDLLNTIVEPTFAKHSPASAFHSDIWEEAMWSVYEIVARGRSRMRPASYKSVLNDMRARDTLESNSGWPLFTRRNKPEVIAHSVRSAENGEWRQYPAVALFRNYNRKTRLVWMFPMSANLVEGSFTQPIQSRLMNEGHDFLAPWQGFDAVRRLISRAYSEGKYVAASDFSATDEHFRLQSSMEVFGVLCGAFQPKYSRVSNGLLRQSIMHMHSIPLVIGPNQMIVGEHGVSSGSNWTNFIETIFDWIFSYYVAYLGEMRGRNDYRGLYAIGDDMAWVSDRYDESFTDRLTVYGKGVGQVIKTEKTNNYPDKVKTLQRLFQRGYNRPSDGLTRGVYSTIRALKSSVYPEKFHDPKDWDSDMFCARQFMILENCVDHPLFAGFVKFVVRGQKDLIPFAQKSASELRRIHRKANLIPGLNPTYNQEKRDQSLETFESIRIARML